MKQAIDRWLTEQFGDDTALHEELYGQYRDDMQAYFAALKSACAACDAESVTRVAHTMKGLALQVGDDETADICKALQLAGQASVVPQHDGLLLRLEELVCAL